MSVFVCFYVSVSMILFVSETRCPRACLSGCSSVGRCVCVGLSLYVSRSVSESTGVNVYYGYFL